MDLLASFKQAFKNGNAVLRLIFINAIVFVLFITVKIVFTLFNVNATGFAEYLAVPASMQMLLYKPWTLITYMFYHEGFFHVFFNMFTLFWFGKIFLMYFSEKQLNALYFIGGFSGAFVFIFSYNIFPYFAPVVPTSILLGASGSIMAIITAVAFRAPNMEMQMLFIGRVKLKWIAVFFILTSFFGITSNNAGGELAHLGGALAGYLFVVSLQRGKDFTKGINRIFDVIHNLFAGKKLKVVRGKSGNRKMSDAEFNVSKARNMQEIDRILDKIKTSGYESLSADEKRKLFEQKK